MKITIKTAFMAVIISAALLSPIPGYAVPGDLFASINGFRPFDGGGSILQYTPTGTQSTFASGLSRPRGLAFDSAGNLFVNTNAVVDVAGNLQGTILKFSPGGTASTFASGFGTNFFLQGMAIGSAGNLFVSGSTDTFTTIFKFTPGGTQSTFASAPNGHFVRIAFDHSGNLFATFDSNTGSSSILEFTPGGTQSTFATSSSDTAAFSGLTFDSAGNLFVSTEGNPGSDTILEFTSGGVESTFATGLTQPRGLAFDSTGNLFVTENPFLGATGDILEFTPGGMETVFASGIGDPRGNGGPEDLAFARSAPDGGATLILLTMSTLGLVCVRRVVKA